MIDHINFFELFGLLIFAHCLADYPLQGSFLSAAKNKYNPVEGAPWTQAMFGHCTIHAGFVGILTGSLALAMVEFVLHFIIDTTKCAGKISYHTDQMLHVGCKLLWALIVFST